MLGRRRDGGAGRLTKALCSSPEAASISLQLIVGGMPGGGGGPACVAPEIRAAL